MLIFNLTVRAKVVIIIIRGDATTEYLTRGSTTPTRTTEPTIRTGH